MDFIKGIFEDHNHLNKDDQSSKKHGIDDNLQSVSTSRMPVSSALVHRLPPLKQNPPALVQNPPFLAQNPPALVHNPPAKDDQISEEFESHNLRSQSLSGETTSSDLTQKPEGGSVVNPLPEKDIENTEQPSQPETTKTSSTISKIGKRVKSDVLNLLSEPEDNLESQSIPRQKTSTDLPLKPEGGPVVIPLSEPEDENTVQPSQSETNETSTKISKIGNRVKSGVQFVASSGDFVGRLGTLLVMAVTTISHGVVLLAHLDDGFTWKSGLSAAILMFVHVPVTILMIWLLLKAKVKSIDSKIRPEKSTDSESKMTDSEVENDKDPAKADTDLFTVTSESTSVTGSNTLTHRGSRNKGFETDGEG